VELLTYHEVHFDQMNPLGLQKVAHFEIACRAFNGRPTVSPFRSFYKFCAQGNWYSFEKRRKVKHPASYIPAPANFGKRTFYVKESFLPVPLRRRSPNYRIKDEAPLAGEYEEGLYTLLVESPTPITTYPEHLLVMAGLSQKWKYHLHRSGVVVDGEG
jgi:hypothetical protein